MFNSENLVRPIFRKNSFYQSKTGHRRGLCRLVRFVSACAYDAQLPPRPHLAMTASAIELQHNREYTAFAKECCVGEGAKSKVRFVPLSRH